VKQTQESEQRERDLKINRVIDKKQRPRYTFKEQKRKRVEINVEEEDNTRETHKKNENG
jgi:hypothetical protein